MQIDIKQLESIIVDFGTNAVLGLLVLFIGFKISNALLRYFTKFLDKKGIDVSLKPFLASSLNWTLKIVVILTAISTAGVKTTSFLALLASAGLAVGLALKGSLSNFAGGVLILILKPFKVGDFIKTSSCMGSVERINVFHTVLKTGDNQIVYVPNGNLSNTVVTNVNHESKRRVDFVFGIGYSDDSDLAKSIIRNILESDPRVHKDSEVFVKITELADNCINISARAWVDTTDYWPVYHENIEKIKKAFDQNQISIPFPQRNVHLHQVLS